MAQALAKHPLASQREEEQENNAGRAPSLLTPYARIHTLQNESAHACAASSAAAYAHRLA